VGIGFAIPSSMAKYVMDQLARFGEVRRGTLGIYVQDLTAELAGAFGLENGRGALVAEVAGESAAERAGIQAGDVITAIADNPVNNAREFHNIEGQLPLGESINLEFFRNQEKMQTRLYAEALKVLDGGAIDRRLKGAIFEELPVKLRSDRIKGVLLSGLESGSQLARNGLRTGDIITGVNRQGISDLSDFQGAVVSVKGGLYLQIHRNGGDYRARID
jgi:serine protease Do/serine protease DegQ